MRNCLERNCNMDDSQIINKYDSILDIIFNGTMYTTKVEMVLTEFDTKLDENEPSYG